MTKSICFIQNLYRSICVGHTITKTECFPCKGLAKTSLYRLTSTFMSYMTSSFHFCFCRWSTQRSYRGYKVRSQVPSRTLARARSLGYRMLLISRDIQSSKMIQVRQWKGCYIGGGLYVWLILKYCTDMEGGGYSGKIPKQMKQWQSRLLLHVIKQSLTFAFLHKSLSGRLAHVRGEKGVFEAKRTGCGDPVVVATPNSS